MQFSTKEEVFLKWTSQFPYDLSQIQQRIITCKYGQTHVIRSTYAPWKNNNYCFSNKAVSGAGFRVSLIKPDLIKQSLLNANYS